MYGDETRRECRLPVSLSHSHFTALTEALYQHDVQAAYLLSSCYTQTHSGQTVLYRLDVSTSLCASYYLRRGWRWQCILSDCLSVCLSVCLSGGATPGRARSNALAKKLLPWLAPWLAPWLTEISINSISSEVHKSAQKLIYLSLLSLIIYHYLSSITSRLRTPSLYHRPATHTERYTSFIHYAVLNYQ